MSFKDEASDVNVVETNDHVLIPRIGWRNGVKQVKQAGFFYIKDSELTNFPTEDSGFVCENVYGEEVGWKAEAIHVAFIGYRMQPMEIIKGEAGRADRTIWLSEWHPGATFFTEILCFVKGIDELLVWTAKGMTGAALTRKGGIVPQMRFFAQDAKKAVGKPLNMWAFYAPISSKRDKKGNVVYTDTGYGSFITPPALDLGDSKDAMDRLWVGRENYQRFAEAFQEAKETGWFTKRRGNQPAQEEPEEDHREPIDFTDDDMPF